MYVFIRNCQPNKKKNENILLLFIYTHCEEGHELMRENGAKSVPWYPMCTSSAL